MLSPSERDSLRQRLNNAAKETFDEYQFRKSVVELCQRDAQLVFERYFLLRFAIADLDHFNFDTED